MLLFEDFTPIEPSTYGNCIWCNTNQTKNKAHIFSKRIIKKNTPANLLKHSVCAKCNTTISNNIEDFLFKMTPLAYLADLFLHRQFKSLKWVPNYYWSDSFGTWIIIIHDSKVGYETRPTQIMVNEDNETLIFINSEGNMESKRIAFLHAIQNDILAKNYTTHISNLFPNNFFPRAFYLDKQLILASKSEFEIEKLKATIFECDENSKFLVKEKGSNQNWDKFQVKFQWNVKSYYDYCAKIAFELFSLVAGRELCLTAGFSELRDTITNYKHIKPFEITFTEENSKRYFSSRFVANGWILYTDAPNDIAIFPMTETFEDNNHTVYIYELQNGLVCATVKLFNIPFAQIILGNCLNPNNFRAWRIDFDISKSQLRFFQAITDPKRIKYYQDAMPDGDLKKTKYSTNPNLIWHSNPRKGGL